MERLVGRSLDYIGDIVTAIGERKGSATGQGGGGSGNANDTRVLFIGQSNMQALGTSAVYAGQVLPAAYVKNDRARIWNRTTHQYETYEPYVNSEGASDSATWGPEAPFAILWLAANPTGILYMDKRTQGSTGFAQDDTSGKLDWAKASGELYAQVTQIVTEATAALAALGKTLAISMCFCAIGEEDSKVLANANAFAANLASFISSSRPDWGYTRFCIVRPHVEQLQSGFPYWSTVRDGVKSVADADRNVEIVITDGAAFVDTTLHRDPASIQKSGRDMYWVYTKGWTKFPYSMLTHIAEIFNQRYVYQFVPGDPTSMKSGTIENVLSVTAPATTARLYRDSLGVRRNNLAANKARVTWVNGRAQLVIEPQVQNLVLWSRDLTQANWVANGVTAVKDQTGLDGVANGASRITATAANGTIAQAFTVASAVKTLAFDVKRLIGAGALRASLDDGATYTPVTVTNGIARVVMPTQTLANPVVKFQIETAGDSFLIDAVDLVAASYATTPVYSAGSAAIRQAEDIRFAYAADGQQPAGAFILRGRNATNTAANFFVGDGRRLLYRAASATTLYSENDAAGTLSATAGGGDFSGDYGVGLTFDAADRRVCMNGGVVANDNSPLTTRTASAPRAGMSQSGNITTALGGFVDALYQGPGKITNAELQALAAAQQAA